MSRHKKQSESVVARPSVAVGYARLLEDGGCPTGLEGQRRLIRSEARRRGLSLVWSCDTSDRRETVDRAGIARSLRLLKTEGHAALIVADLACLTQSLPVLSAIFRRSAEEGWSIVSLGRPRIDTARREGKALRSVLGRYNTFLDVDDETAVVDAAGVERATQPRPSPRERIVWERIAGASLGQIANDLNRDGVPGPDDSENWLPSTVWAELEIHRPNRR